MRIIDVMPNEGQFLEMWVWSGVIWSDTLRWKEGYLQEYCSDDDSWSTRVMQDHTSPQYLVISK